MPVALQKVGGNATGLQHRCLIPDFQWLKWLFMFWLPTVAGFSDFSVFKNRLKIN